MSTYRVTVLFRDGKEDSQHSTRADVTKMISGIIDDLTDEKGKPLFRSITITPVD